MDGAKHSEFSRSARGLRYCLFLLGFWLTVTYWQWYGGAFLGAFGAEPDEASHYVTSLMIRDYIADGFPGNPVSFAEDFYLHYPRVAFGLWPPLFHLCSGVWMFLFGDHRSSVLALLALITAVWAFLCFRALESRFGTVMSWVAGMVLISLPAVQSSSMSVMLDLAVALFILMAMLQYARYLNSESNRDALIFGLLAGVAALVKYNGLLLALVPPICVLITGRHALLRRVSFWLPAVVVPVVAGPWYISMRHLVFYAAEPGGEMHFWRTAVANIVGIMDLGGLALFIVASLGVFVAVRRARRHTDDSGSNSLYVSAAAVLAASWIFHSLLYPIEGQRYQLPAAASLVILALVAGQSGTRFLNFSPLPPRWLQIAAMSALLFWYASFSFYVPRKNTHYFAQVAEQVLAEPLASNSVILVAADGGEEGMLVSEIAMRGPRPRYFVARASKFLVRQTLMGQEYRSLFSDAEEFMKALDEVPVSMVVLDETALRSSGEHGRLLAGVPAQMPERWKLLHSIPKGDGDHVRIYRLSSNSEKPFHGLSVDMRYTLGRSIGTSGVMSP